MLAFWPRVEINRLKGSIRKPQNYTCCGRIHVEVALVVCMCIEFFLGLLQFILTTHHKVVFAGIPDTMVKFFDTVEFFALCMLSIAMWNKSPKWMFPYMGLQFYFFLGWSLYTFLFIITFIFPALPVKSLTPHMDAFVYVTIFEAWFLKVSIACYMYYSNRDKDPLMPRPTPFQENNNRVGPIIDVFENPNYNDKSDDDLDFEAPVFSSFPNANSIA